MVVGPISTDVDETIFAPPPDYNPCSHPSWDYHPTGIAGRECAWCGHRELLYRAPYEVPSKRPLMPKMPKLHTRGEDDG